MALRIIMLGDIVGKPGRRVVQQHVAELRREYEADLVLANAENVAGGSGITHALYQRLVGSGLDGLTLGDHCFRQKDITPVMGQLDKLTRPYNLPAAAAGNGTMTLQSPAGSKLHVITLLGRMYMPGLVGGDPFAAADAFIDSVKDDGGAILVEIHAEATGEKLALAHYLDGRVAAVVGSHTHVPTADARVLPGGTAYLSDLGMCGPYDSVLGRRKQRVVQFMSTAMPAPFDVASDKSDTRLSGAFIQINDTGQAVHIERIERAADLGRSPFAEAK